MRLLTTSAVCLVSAALCACAEVPAGDPAHIVSPVAGITASKAVGEPALDGDSVVAYDAIELGKDNVLGRGSAFPMRVVGPLLAKTSPKGTRYCGRARPLGNRLDSNQSYYVLTSVCFSMAELREMHVDSYRVVRLAGASPNRVEQKLLY